VVDVGLIKSSANSVLPAGFYWDEKLKLGEETAALTAKVWPNYLVLESDRPEAALTFEISEAELIRRFPVWGIRRTETHELVAFINAVQIAIDEGPSFPKDGWFFALNAGVKKTAPNCLCLLVANVDPSARGFGFSSILIQKSKQEALALGFDTLIAPVRPTLKHNFPMMPTDEYLAKRSKNGECFYPWIQLHEKLGGEILNVCAESVEILASLGKWREWTGLPLQTAGSHILPGGLVPLQIDLEKNLGIYREPNVWIRYSLK
jgi:GNAT superfamily N-acetyltransferase